MLVFINYCFVLFDCVCMCGFCNVWVFVNMCNFNLRISLFVYCVLYCFLYVHLFLFVLSGWPSSVVSIATAYGLDGQGIESRWGEIFRTSSDRT